MVSSNASARVTKERWRLAVFLGALLILPAFVSHWIPSRRDFDSKPITHLRKKQPDVVLIGDSVLGGSIDPVVLARELGVRRAELLWNGGAASAAWYLLMKNYVVEAGIHPRLVCIFFRDRMLTDANFRTTPTYRRFLESIRHEEEPVFETVLEGEEKEKGLLGRLLDRLYPLQTRRHVQQEKISRLAYRIAAAGEPIGRLRRQVNAIFDPAKLRDEIMDESAQVSAEPPEEFTADPRLNFLPHIVETARQAGLRLCFVREKRHPLPDGTTQQSGDIQRYTKELAHWLESQGYSFIDLTSNSSLDQSMYLKPGDDHIRPEAKEAVTKIYAAKLRLLLAQ